MTRDEAIARVEIIYDPNKLTNPPTIIVDALASLGMLKLDEPKSENAGKQFEQELKAYMMPVDIQAFMNWMDEAKLKIVRA